jgi:hypothetical protein
MVSFGIWIPVLELRSFICNELEDFGLHPVFLTFVLVLVLHLAFEKMLLNAQVSTSIDSDMASVWIS